MSTGLWVVVWAVTYLVVILLIAGFVAWNELCVCRVVKEGQEEEDDEGIGQENEGEEDEGEKGDEGEKDDEQEDVPVWRLGNVCPYCGAAQYQGKDSPSPAPKSPSSSCASPAD